MDQKKELLDKLLDTIREDGWRQYSNYDNEWAEICFNEQDVIVVEVEDSGEGETVIRLDTIKNKSEESLKFYRDNGKWRTLDGGFGEGEHFFEVAGYNGGLVKNPFMAVFSKPSK